MFDSVKLADREVWVWGAFVCVWAGASVYERSGGGPTRTRKPPPPGLKRRGPGSGGYEMPKKLDGM